MKHKPILIVSTSLDEHAYRPVIEALDSRGRPSVVYATDRVFQGIDSFSLALSPDSSIELIYNDSSIAPDDVGAAWYRKPNTFDIEGTSNDRGKFLDINYEIARHHEAIWSMYDHEQWLNSPERMRLADRKLGQLVVASEMGFSIPQTLMGNDWGSLESRLLKDDDRMIVKMIRGIFSANNKMSAMYTSVLDGRQIKEIRNMTIPFPGMYQPYVEKLREWRVTVVEEAIFSAAIYTGEEAKDDWRRLQSTGAVQFCVEQLPDDIAEKCHSMLGRLGLKYGAFDLIETPDGEMVFLECNPNGQYGWLESQLGFPISQEIANSLVRISDSRE